MRVVEIWAFKIILKQNSKKIAQSRVTYALIGFDSLLLFVMILAKKTNKNFLGTDLNWLAQPIVEHRLLRGLLSLRIWLIDKQLVCVNQLAIEFVMQSELLSIDYTLKKKFNI